VNRTAIEGGDATGPAIAGVGRALPAHHVSQEVLTEALRAHWAKAHFNPARLDELHRAVGVKGRYLALPLEAYPALDSFAKSNAAWLEVATELGAAALSEALARAGLRPDQLDHLFFVTVTGVATPTVDARLVNRLRLRSDLKRTPIFGLGCVAGAAGLARASDYLRGFPGETAALLSVELCSLTLQRNDLSIPNMIASGLFGDGAAAVVLRGGEREPEAGVDRPADGPRVVASRSIFYPDTERVMGWDIQDTGFKVVLSPKVPELARAEVGGNVDAFLASRGLVRSDIRHWVAHTGGPKVLEAFASALGLSREQLALSWESLGAVGNLSSASVLFVLRDLLDGATARPGDLGLLLAMGPGFCAELVLLQW
jgi:alkylresorcinol/alkylpyrone synthase